MPARVQDALGLNRPLPEDLKATVPVGVVAVPTSVSVTVAVHVVAEFTVTGDGVQLILVIVVRGLTVTLALPLLPA